MQLFSCARAVWFSVTGIYGGWQRNLVKCGTQFLDFFVPVALTVSSRFLRESKT